MHRKVDFRIYVPKCFFFNFLCFESYVPKLKSAYIFISDCIIRSTLTQYKEYFGIFGGLVVNKEPKEQFSYT
jgi:hypothetical protein